MRAYHYLLFFIAMVVAGLILTYSGTFVETGQITVVRSARGAITSVMPRGGSISVVMNSDGTVTAKPAGEDHFSQSYKKLSGCDFPPLDSNSELVLLSAYDTQSISSTALYDETGVSVGAGTLTIEDGNTPLYIVLVSFDPVIWQVKGAVDRVRFLVLAAQKTTGATLFGDGSLNETLVGATGIDRNKVRFLENHDCMHHFQNNDSPEAAFAASAFEYYIGRKPNVMSGSEHVSGFSVPSGDIDRFSTRGSIGGKLARQLKVWLGQITPAEAQLEYDMESFHPGGVVLIDAKNVVSIQPAKAYSIYPEEAGLLQLLHRGDLTPDGEGNMTFVINRQIRLPAELYGSHARHFLLPVGVPMPSGNVGHSCIKSKATGKPLTDNITCDGLWLGLQALQ